MAEPSPPPATAPRDDPALPLVIVERAGLPVPTSPSRAHRVLRAVRFVPLIWILVATGGVIGLYFQPPGLQKLMQLLGLQPGGGTNSPIAVPAPLPEAAKPAPPRLVIGLGKLLPEGEVITVAPPFGAGDARIAALRVAEGDRVEPGAVLAVLDNERQLLAAVDSARATVGAREAMLAQVRAATEASRNEAQASLSRAESAAQTATRDFERAESLRQRGFAADQTFDQRKAARDEAQREVERARATLSRYAGAIDGQADVLVAARNLDSATADLARASADLEKAYVRAPRSSTVLTIIARPGEKPGSQGIMNLGDISRMKVEVEVYQNQIGRVTLGDPVAIAAEALPRALTGTVTRIGLEVGRQTLIDASPAANTDARVVKVSVALDPESTLVAQRFTNLQVTARISITGDL